MQCAGSVALSMWGLPRPGLEPCPLHWQADSSPPYPSGSPKRLTCACSAHSSDRCQPALLRGHDSVWLFAHVLVHVNTFLVAGSGAPLQCSRLENPMDGGAWRAAVHGSLRVGHNRATSLSLFTFMHWRRKWQPTPVFLPGESQGRGSLVGCRLWGRTESDMTEGT